MIGSADQVFKKLEEAQKALVTFNAAGIAGIIGLIQKDHATPLIIRGAGVVFLVGIFAGVACWIFSMSGSPGDDEMPIGRNLESEFYRMTIALYVSVAAFLVGVIAAFIGAG